MNLNSDSDKWWQMISGGNSPSVSPFNDYMNQQGQQTAQMAGGSALANWLRNPRTPGQSSATQMPPAQPYTPPAAPQNTNRGGGTDAASILSQGYGYHPTMGFVSLDPRAYQQAQQWGDKYNGAFAVKAGRTPEQRLQLLLQGYNPDSDGAFGVSGFPGPGNEGTDGGIY